MIDSSVSSSLTVGEMWLASTEMPKKKPPRMVPMAIRVVAALWLSGLRKAGTPLEMASMPVSATAPEEKARSTSRIPTAPSVVPPLVISASRSGFGGRASRWKKKTRTSPTPTSRPSETTYT